MSQGSRARKPSAGTRRSSKKRFEISGPVTVAVLVATLFAPMGGAHAAIPPAPEGGAQPVHRDGIPDSDETPEADNLPERSRPLDRPAPLDLGGKRDPDAPGLWDYDPRARLREAQIARARRQAEAKKAQPEKHPPEVPRRRHLGHPHPDDEPPKTAPPHVEPRPHTPEQPKRTPLPQHGRVSEENGGTEQNKSMRPPDLGLLLGRTGGWTGQEDLLRGLVQRTPGADLRLGGDTRYPLTPRLPEQLINPGQGGPESTLGQPGYCGPTKLPVGTLAYCWADPRQLLQSSARPVNLAPASPALNQATSGPVAPPPPPSVSAPAAGGDAGEPAPGGGAPASGGGDDSVSGGRVPVDAGVDRGGKTDAQRQAEIDQREEQQRLDRAARDQKQKDQIANDAAYQQQVLDDANALTEKNAAEGQAYTDERDRKAAEEEAERQAQAEAEAQRQREEDQRNAPPPPPPATPPTYREPEPTSDVDEPDETPPTDTTGQTLQTTETIVVPDSGIIVSCADWDDGMTGPCDPNAPSANGPAPGGSNDDAWGL